MAKCYKCGGKIGWFSGGTHPSDLLDFCPDCLEKWNSTRRQRLAGSLLDGGEVKEEFRIPLVETSDFRYACQKDKLIGDLIFTDKGIILITGCAHPGIEEMVKTARNLVRDDLLLVMGGFHLAGTSESVIAQIVSNMKKWGVRYAGPCHCSGDLARRLFKNEFGNTYIDVGVGKIIKLE